MNERIRELAEQAGYKPLPGFDFANSLQEVFLKKLAELIVRECSGILRTEADSNWEGREERLLNAMANWIEQHFGVE